MAAPAHVLWQDCDIEALWHSSPFRLLGSWHQGALTVMLAQPSSAPVERIFSMLKTVINDHDQQCAMRWACRLSNRIYDALVNEHNQLKLDLSIIFVRCNIYKALFY